MAERSASGAVAATPAGVTKIGVRVDQDAACSTAEIARDLHISRHRLTPARNCIVLAMVGLPARGKSFISKKLERLLQWRGMAVRIFNVGERRRALAQGRHDATFFSEANRSTREAIATGTLDEMVEWLRSEPGKAVAIFDATNSHISRRRIVSQALREQLPGASLVFVESICDDEATVEHNLLQKVRNSPDYRQMDEAAALADLKKRIDEYQTQYETLTTQEEQPYIKASARTPAPRANRSRPPRHADVGRTAGRRPPPTDPHTRAPRAFPHACC